MISDVMTPLSLTHTITSRGKGPGGTLFSLRKMMSVGRCDPLDSIVGTAVNRSFSCPVVLHGTVLTPTKSIVVAEWVSNHNGVSSILPITELDKGKSSSFLERDRR